MKMLVMNKKRHELNFHSDIVPTEKSSRILLTIFLILLIIGASPVFLGASARSLASSLYKVTLTTANFSQTLQAAAIDLSDPSHALFYVQNGTPLWYSISIQSTPAGISPTVANPGDLFTATSPLLPPASV